MIGFFPKLPWRMFCLSYTSYVANMTTGQRRLGTEIQHATFPLSAVAEIQCPPSSLTNDSTGLNGRCRESHNGTAYAFITILFPVRRRHRLAAGFDDDDIESKKLASRQLGYSTELLSRCPRCLPCPVLALMGTRSASLDLVKHAKTQSSLSIVQAAINHLDRS